MNDTVMLLHLIRKDLRSRFGTLMVLWAGLVLQAGLPLLRARYDVLELVIWFDRFCNVAGACLLALLLVDFIHADHPSDQSAFLLTRPVERSKLVLAKFLAWGGAVAMPVVLAQMLRLAMQRLDLRTADYLRVAAVDTMVVVGVFGVVAMIGVGIWHLRAALGLVAVNFCVMAVMYSVTHDPLWEHLSENESSKWVIEENRLLSMWLLVGTGGFVLAYAALRRVRPTVMLGMIIGFGLLGAGARFARPVNLLWRNERVIEIDEQRLERAHKERHLYHANEVSFSRWRSPQGDVQYCGSITSVAFAGPLVHEWAVPKSYEAWMTFENGSSWHAKAGPYGPGDQPGNELARSGLDVEITGDLSRTWPPFPALMAAVGLPAHDSWFTMSDSREFAQPAMVMNFHQVGHWFDGPPPATNGSKVRIHGTADCRWLRACVVAKLPVKPGARYVHDGHSILVRSCALIDGGLKVKFSLDHCDSILESWSCPDAEGDARLALCIVNPSRGQIAVRAGHAEDSRRVFDLIGVESRDRIVPYMAADEGRHGEEPLPMTEEWLAGAFLFVIEKREFGRTTMPFDFDAKVRLDASFKEVQQ